MGKGFYIGDQYFPPTEKDAEPVKGDPKPTPRRRKSVKSVEVEPPVVPTD